MNHTNTNFLISIVFALGLLVAFQSNGLASSKSSGYDALLVDLKACSAATDAAIRLECFDSLAGVYSDKEIQPETLPENLGGGKFDDKEKKIQGSRGLVTSCKKSHDGKWFFIFDSGQIWKQTDRVKRRYRKCNFNVTVTEDGFGYNMLIDEDPRPIRIKRHR